MRGLLIDIKEWFVEMARVFRHQFDIVCHDAGVLIFFLFLPLVYPVIYSLIYNPEVTRKLPVVVVDHDRTSMSREFTRHLDGCPGASVVGYAADLNGARRLMNEKECFAILEIPDNYMQSVGRGEQGQINMYYEMSLLLRYRTLLSAMTELQLATGAQLRTRFTSAIGMTQDAPSNVGVRNYFLGDTQQGFASFILPGIVVLILQQSMLLGICMLDGGSNERRRRNNGYDPMQVQASPSASCIGKALCYTAIYFPLTIFILHFIPVMFSFPHIGSFGDYFLLILPMLLATAFLGQSMQFMMSERESAFVVVVFTSVAFLFLSGLTWPRYAMNDFFRWMGNLVPATWGLEGFVRINSNGGTLARQSTCYFWLWGLTLFFFATAWLSTRRRVSRP